MDGTREHLGSLISLTATLLLAAGCGSDSGSDNTAPTIQLGQSQYEVTEGKPVSFFVQADDADGDTLSVAWTQKSGPTAVLTGANTYEPAFIAPQVPEEASSTGNHRLQFEVRVDDGRGGVATATVDVSVEHVWNFPECESITGSRHIAFSRDGGKTFVYPEEVQPTYVSYVPGLIALSQPGHMLLSASTSGGTTLQLSRDYGCSWEDIGTIDSDYLLLSSAGGDIAYGWSWFNNQVHRIDTNAEPGNNIDTTEVTLRAPSAGLKAMDVLRDNDNELLIEDRSGFLYRSSDGGITWSDPAPSPLTALRYHASAQSDNLDHVTMGTSNDGAYVTYDGGASWTLADIISETYYRSNVNIFRTVIAPDDGNIVWALGLNLDERFDGASTQGRHIYRSDDGGLTYRPVVDSYQEEALILTNGSFLHAPKGRPQELFFTFFSCWVADEDDYENPGRTYLYLYNHETGEVTIRKHKELEGVSSVFLAPNDPGLIYVGMDSDNKC